MLKNKLNQKKYKVPLALLLINALLFLGLAPFFEVKKIQEVYLHSAGEEKYIDKTADIVNWGYALFKILRDNASPDKR